VELILQFQILDLNPLSSLNSTLPLSNLIQIVITIAPTFVSNLWLRLQMQERQGIPLQVDVGVVGGIAFYCGYYHLYLFLSSLRSVFRKNVQVNCGSLKFVIIVNSLMYQDHTGY
jgi:uncharacterized membrane-anchored protein